MGGVAVLVKEADEGNVMKAVWCSLGLLLATSAQASFQVGKVTEVAIGHQNATFQLDTSDGGLGDVELRKAARAIG